MYYKSICTYAYYASNLGFLYCNTINFRSRFTLVVTPPFQVGCILLCACLLQKKSQKNICVNTRGKYLYIHYIRIHTWYNLGLIMLLHLSRKIQCNNVHTQNIQQLRLLRQWPLRKNGRKHAYCSCGYTFPTITDNNNIVRYHSH